MHTLTLGAVCLVCESGPNDTVGTVGAANHGGAA